MRWAGTVVWCAVMRDPDDELVCHACDAPIEGEPAGRGLLLFPRGDDVLREEPPLCERCAHAVCMTALHRWELEEEEG